MGGAGLLIGGEPPPQGMEYSQLSATHGRGGAVHRRGAAPQGLRRSNCVDVATKGGTAWHCVPTVERACVPPPRLARRLLLLIPPFPPTFPGALSPPPPSIPPRPSCPPPSLSLPGVLCFSPLLHTLTKTVSEDSVIALTVLLLLLHLFLHDYK